MPRFPLEAGWQGGGRTDRQADRKGQTDVQAGTDRQEDSQAAGTDRQAGTY